MLSEMTSMRSRPRVRSSSPYVYNFGMGSLGRGECRVCGRRSGLICYQPWFILSRSKQRRVGGELKDSVMSMCVERRLDS